MQEIQIASRILSTFCCSLFAGAAIYVNLVEHPARMECGTEIAAKEFGPSYRRATQMQVPLALVSFLSSIFAWLNGANVWWLVGGVLLMLVVPFTLILILPTNKKLLAPNLDKSSPQAHQLLSRWNRLHAIRSLLSLISLAIFLLNS